MSSKPGPKVTVFTAVYNRRELLPRAIESVLSQRFPDFELLVLDDGSTDGSADVARRYADPRVRVVRREEHRGIPRTRNEGLALARGEYLAILDSDDTALPGRLERQVCFLDGRPEIAAVGGFALRIERDGRSAWPVLRPTRPRDIRARILFTTCFKHPTLMARTSAMREIGYRDEFTYCQDIDLFSRMSAKYPLANLPEFLTRYRLGGESHRDGALAATLKKRTAEDQLRDLGVAHDATDLDRHYALRNPRALRSPQALRNPKGLRADAEFVTWCDAWLSGLLAANRDNPCYPEPEFTQAAAERWWRVALTARGSDVPLRRFARHETFGPLLPVLAGRLAGIGARALSAALRAPLP